MAGVRLDARSHHTGCWKEGPGGAPNQARFGFSAARGCSPSPLEPLCRFDLAKRRWYSPHSGIERTLPASGRLKFNQAVPADLFVVWDTQPSGLPGLRWQIVHYRDR